MALCENSWSASTIATVCGLGFCAAARSKKPLVKAASAPGRWARSGNSAGSGTASLTARPEQRDERPCCAASRSASPARSARSHRGRRRDRPCRRRGASCRCRAPSRAGSGRRNRRACTGRPSSPPLALTSSSQICIASSADLPLGASPPVSAMLKPILIGSAARAVAPQSASTRASAIGPSREMRCIGRPPSWFIAPRAS